MSDAILTVSAVIVLLGVVAQVLSDRYRVPSVLFLIVAGIVLGPEGVGLVTRETFGDGLFTVVAFSVAVILFDGAFHLHLAKLRRAPRATLRLVTVGALLMLVGTAVAVRLFLETSWEIAFLIGALLVATGPTVITPILDVVTVRDQVEAALEAEGIINDVTAAVFAVVIFEMLVVEALFGPALVVAFLQRIAVGVLVGGGVAGVIWYALGHLDLSPTNAPRLTRVIVLAGVFSAFAGAEGIVGEAGIAAVAIAGILLGNADLPHREEIAAFTEALTTFVLSFVFIALAALIEFDAILALGLGGVAVVALVTLIVRPLLVFLSVRGEQFTRGERLFLSAVGPRGIIPASVATLFAIQLEAVGDAAAAETLVGTVFLIIFVTVVLQAGFARQIADALDVVPMTVIIAGGGRVGQALADRLTDRGENVVIVDDDPSTVERVRDAGYTAYEGDATESELLREVGIDRARIVVAATGDDEDNLLIAQLARSKFGVERVLARVNRPENVAAFDTLDVEVVSASLATAWSLDNRIERPALDAWMNQLGEGHDVQEIEVTTDEFAGRTIAEVGSAIPDGCIVAMIGREGSSHVPDGDTVLERGDHVTFLGRKDAVREAIRRFHPHD